MIAFAPITFSNVALEEQNVKANRQMLHPFITLLWVEMFAKQIIHWETYSFALVLLTAVMPYCGVKQRVPTLFHVGNILPIGPELRRSVLEAVLHAQKRSWIGFLKAHVLPSFWPLPFPD